MLITTVDGPRDDSELRRVDTRIENDNEIATAVEYYDGNRLVHRSAHVTLKHVGVIGAALAASLA